MIYQQVYFLNTGKITEACNLAIDIENEMGRYHLSGGVKISLIFNNIIAYLSDICQSLQHCLLATACVSGLIWLFDSNDGLVL